MKKLASYLIPLAGIVLILFPQRVKGWAQSYFPPKVGNYIHQTTDGGYVFVGDFENGSFLRDICLIKIDSLGIILWSRTLRSGDWNPERAKCMQLTDDGGYIIVGYRGHTPSPWLIKTDSLGDTLWTRTYFQDEYGDKGRFVEVTDDGGYIITGSTASSGGGDVFLLKTDSLGDTLWTRTYDAGIDIGYCVRQTTDGGYIITGRTAPNAEAKDRLWFVKTDGSGNILWDKSYWGISEANSVGYSVQETADGGYIVVGEKDALLALGEGDLWLLKTNASGDTTWTRTYDGRYQLTDWGSFVRQTQDGGYIITGGANSRLFAGEDLWLLKTDSWGDTLWTRIYERSFTQGIAAGYCVQQTADGGYIVSGQKDLTTWLLKTDSLGDTLTAIVEDRFTDAPTFNVDLSLGSTITLQYSNCPEGFHARVFDASGRKVDEVHSSQTSGSISWGEDARVGVYFIRELSGRTAHKVVLVR